MSGVFPISLRRQAILPMVVVLPVPLTPTMRITVGWLETSMRCSSGSSGRRSSATTSASSFWNGSLVSIFLARAALLELVDDLDGAVDAHVGGDQHLLGLLVEPPVHADVHGALEPVDDGPAGLAEVAAQAAEEAPALLRFFFQHRRRHLGLVDALEHLVPLHAGQSPVSGRRGGRSLHPRRARPAAALARSSRSISSSAMRALTTWDAPSCPIVTP